jgi:DNA polymerase III subunit gamma/tau
MLAEQREGILYGQLASCLHLVRFEAGHIEFRPTADAPRDLSTRLGQFLLEETGQRWLISVSREPGEPTIRQQAETRKAARLAEVAANPLVQATLALFPGASIDKIIDPEPEAILPAELPPELKLAEIKPIEDEAPPALYESDDPGPFGLGQGWDVDDEMGDEP